MISGFAQLAEGRVETVASSQDLVNAWHDDQALVWVDYEEPTAEDLAALVKIIPVNEACIDDCLHGEQRPRVDEFDDHIFLLLYGALPPNGERFDPRKLAVFSGRRFLITVHREPIKTVRAVLDRCARNQARALANGVDAVMFQIIDGMVDNYVLVADGYEDRIASLEEDSLDPDVDESVLVESSELRRGLLMVRSFAVSQRELLLPMTKGECEYISETLEQRFGHVRDHLTQVIEQVDSMREHLAAVRDNYNTAVANRTNAIMKTLTLMATIMLPLTLIAGIYGMNLPLWPPPGQPLSFWGVLCAMAATTIALLFYFRRKKWI